VAGYADLSHWYIPSANHAVAHSSRCPLTVHRSQSLQKNCHIEVWRTQAAKVPGKPGQQCFGKRAVQRRQPLQLTHVASLQSYQVLKIYHQVWQGERTRQEEESFGLIVLSVVPEQSL